MVFSSSKSMICRRFASELQRRSVNSILNDVGVKGSNEIEGKAILEALWGFHQSFMTVN